MEEPGRIDVAEHRGGDLLQRLELVRPRSARLVEARVLDRDRGLRGEKRHKLFVLVRKVGAALLFGQVEVSVRNAAEHDRHPEEALHGRVVGRETDGALVLGDVVQTERACVPDEDAQDAAAPRQVADRGVRLGVDPVRDEPLQLAPRHVDDAERRVAGSRQLGCRFGQELQEAVERQLGADRDSGFYQTLEGRLSLPGGHLGSIRNNC